ncbi:MAG TPA: hypothetical protein VK714_22630 [Myxococcota bacterium]|nr:hypothetical protein [Myxococcota bacterium]
MKPLIASTGTALLAIVGLACASPDTRPKLTWLRTDGTPATRAELQAAKEECLAQTPTDTASPHPRVEHQAYGSKIIQCVQSKGYQLVDEDKP